MNLNRLSPLGCRCIHSRSRTPSFTNLASPLPESGLPSARCEGGVGTTRAHHWSWARSHAAVPSGIRFSVSCTGWSTTYVGHIHASMQHVCVACNILRARHSLFSGQISSSRTPGLHTSSTWLAGTHEKTDEVNETLNPIPSGAQRPRRLYFTPIAAALSASSTTDMAFRREHGQHLRSAEHVGWRGKAGRRVSDAAHRHIQPTCIQLFPTQGKYGGKITVSVVLYTGGTE